MAAAYLRAGGRVCPQTTAGGSKGKEMPQSGKSHHEIEAGPGTRQGKCWEAGVPRDTSPETSSWKVETPRGATVGLGAVGEHHSGFGTIQSGENRVAGDLGHLTVWTGW